MLHIKVRKTRGEFVLDAQFSLHEAGIVALFGPSGCGKSTLINLIAGLLTPDSGSIQLHERVLFDSQQHINVPSEARGLGYLFQNARLFPHYTVLGNLRYGLRRSRNALRINEANVIELLGLGALLKRHPAQLSGGEAQRVALARALLAQPDVLLLDEPLASLDAARRGDILPYFKRVRDELKIPMVYVSHQFEEVLQLATQMVLMQAGGILAQGAVTDLSLTPALRTLVGADAIGAVLDAPVMDIDAQQQWATLQVGSGTLQVDAAQLTLGQTVRVQLLARDLILSLHDAAGLSVRNRLAGVISALQPDADNAVLVTVAVGSATLIARITQLAADELQLRPGMNTWVLVKAMMLRGHTFA